MKNEISKWLQFSDNEIGIFQNYFIDYIKENLELFDTEKIYYSGVLSTQIQHEMRVIKSRINGDKNNSDGDINYNNKFIELIQSLPKLVDFIISKFENDFNQLEESKRFDYLIRNKNSYFNLSKEIKQSLIKDFKKIEKQLC